MRLARVGKPAGDNDPASVEIDLEHARCVERQGNAGVELDDVVRNARRDLADPAELPSSSTLRPTSWKT